MNHHHHEHDHQTPITAGGIAKIIALFALCWEMVVTGISPKGDAPTAWYDRTIRIVGGILISATFAFGLIGWIMDKISR